MIFKKSFKSYVLNYRCRYFSYGQLYACSRGRNVAIIPRVILEKVPTMKHCRNSLLSIIDAVTEALKR